MVRQDLDVVARMVRPPDLEAAAATTRNPLPTASVSILLSLPHHDEAGSGGGDMHGETARSRGDGNHDEKSPS